uniref:Histone H2A n=1 Tax=Parastrongyloides trichosuri TaxID=131310 RepID=A0A0N4ZAX8_PARTI
MAVGKSQLLTKKTYSQRAGLSFPVADFHVKLHQGKYAKNIELKASIFLTAVLQYLCSECFRLTGDSFNSRREQMIRPSDINYAIRTSNDLNKIFKKVTIPFSDIVVTKKNDI